VDFDILHILLSDLFLYYDAECQLHVFGNYEP
jgi:hypothetical protein